MHRWPRERIVVAPRDGDRPAGQACAVDLRERPVRAVDPAEWDRFVIACGGSFMCAWSVVSAYRLLGRVRIFDVVAPDSTGHPVKVGQCAVCTGPARVRVLDRLLLMPGSGHLWDACMQQVLACCGRATYEYGSLWNHEDHQPPAVAAAEGARAARRAFSLDLVDFSAWPDFAAYRRSVSENIRRDFRKAEADSARVVRRQGWRALGDLDALVRLRGEVMRKNGESFSALADYGRHLVKLACLRDHAFIATARTTRGCHAVFFGVAFGDNLYYLGGGTAADSNGAGSFLFLTLIEDWFRDHPRGRLYLGAQVGGLEPAAYTRGNLLYRRKLRATQVRGTAFALTMDAPAERPHAVGLRRQAGSGRG
ncbi:MAG: hypothetical protein R2712_18110 [Vicinamibacterales bacterium]